MKGRLWVLAVSALIGVASVETFHAIFLEIVLIAWFLKKDQRLSAFAVATFLLFFTYMFVIDQANQTVLVEGENQLIGVISTIPAVNGNQLSFEIKTNEEKLQVNYYISSEDEKLEMQQLQVGLTCHLSGALESPSQLRVPSLFDYKQFLYYKEIHWIYTLNKKPTCRHVATSMMMSIQQFRQQMLSAIKNDYPVELQGIASSLLIGDRSLLTNDLESAYQDLGLSHVLAVSGLHVGVTGGLLFWFLIRIGITRERVYVILLFFYPVYMGVTGFAPSVIRASLMAMGVVLSMRLRMKINPLDGISSACIAILAVNPFYAFHIGFQLSFLIAFALIVSSSRLLKRYKTPFTQLLALSSLAQIVSFPVVIYHFHEISLLSLPLNLIYVPIVSVIILPMLLILTFIRTFHIMFLFDLLSNVLSPFVEFFHHVFIWATNLHYTVIFGKLSEVELLVATFICLLVLLQWEVGKVRNGIVIWLLFSATLYVLPYINPYGEVTFLDVGQGDCIVITLPYQQQVILIDTGGKPSYGEKEEWQQKSSSFDVGEDIVVPYLKSRGIRAIDLLILTHGDYDHAGGAAAVLDQLNVKRMIIDHSPVQTDIENNLIETAHRKGTKVSQALTGQSWRKGKASFSILQALEEGEENNGSVVLFAVIGGYKWLFTGDLEEPGERLLLTSELLPEIDILKVGHHGSSTSSSEAFLKKLNPSIAIISAGVDNRYGHPNGDVIERLKKFGIGTVRTDQSGTITYKFITNRNGKWITMLK
ncbi:DNA internalization-related competence protein ComEC/Rec2 [Pseudalkalibacillus hwajinpoensis]|uniref:DNA internalization-related competence protein ComEC/Rec2 n=1 Tax=Guptibacillus hwajinpoensis TaxID=208199 RepID=A0A4U1MGX0_9BACL|nr:DNA internalization-related competence protein ComEC/Rec2 [Pseudalkalibacillus hwajinpoensis]TKD70193.1 DNA internalization-related competence protein ComEC/Rec2 [Pseudalkalibacillus hwajinpoensis]